MDLASYLIESARRVDGWLDKALPPADAPPAALHAAMRHLLFPGGKRIRPALCFAAAEALGAPAEVALPEAAALELVHTYSLVHDDLPCMDDDAERRGRPTVHVLYGEAVALLAGDALLAAAFEALATAGEAGPGRLQNLAELARTAGAAGLVGGQVDDLAWVSDDPRSMQVEDIHLRKTAALFRASVVCGGRAAGAGADALAGLARYGERVGLVFQAADDLLDRDDDDGCSLVAAIGESATRERAEAWLAEALGAVEGFGPEAETLRELAGFALRRHA